MKTCDMNIRGVDSDLYREFKSKVYSKGYKNVKECMMHLMTRFISEEDTKPKKKNGTDFFDLDFKPRQSQTS
jgi:hypothetical protein